MHDLDQRGDLRLRLGQRHGQPRVAHVEAHLVSRVAAAWCGSSQRHPAGGQILEHEALGRPNQRSGRDERVDRAAGVVAHAGTLVALVRATKKLANCAKQRLELLRLDNDALEPLDVERRDQSCFVDSTFKPEWSESLGTLGERLPRSTRHEHPKMSLDRSVPQRAWRDRDGPTRLHVVRDKDVAQPATDLVVVKIPRPCVPSHSANADSSRLHVAPTASRSMTANHRLICWYRTLAEMRSVATSVMNMKLSRPNHASVRVNSPCHQRMLERTTSTAMPVPNMPKNRYGSRSSLRSRFRRAARRHSSTR